MILSNNLPSQLGRNVIVLSKICEILPTYGKDKINFLPSELNKQYLAMAPRILASKPSSIAEIEKVVATQNITNDVPNEFDVQPVTKKCLKKAKNMCPIRRKANLVAPVS